MIYLVPETPDRVVDKAEKGVFFHRAVRWKDNKHTI